MVYVGIVALLLALGVLVRVEIVNKSISTKTRSLDVKLEEYSSFSCRRDEHLEGKSI